MPVVDVKNLEGKKVGQIDLADDVFAAKVNAHLLHEAVRHHLAGRARRNAQDEGQERSFRLGQETVEAEGHGTRARRFDPVAFVAARRHSARPGATQLRLCVAEENDSGRAALGAVRKSGGAEIDGSGRLESGIAQDQSVPRDAGQIARSRPKRACWWKAART